MEPEIDELSPEFLLMAYAGGYFPMADEMNGEIRWYSPDPRGIFELDKIKISRSLRQVLKKNIFETRFDTAFADVIRMCSRRSQTWISEAIIEAYERLFSLGFAHSVETYCDNMLVGGLYGVSLGGAFFGESMFSLKRDASKVALVALVERLFIQGFTLLDTQFLTPHLSSLGAIEISREEYLQRLRDSLEKRCVFR